MHLAFLFEFNPALGRDRWPAAKLGHWGHCLEMAASLEQAGHRVTRIGGLDKTGEHRSQRAKLWRKFYAWQNRRYLAWAEPRFNRSYARQLAAQLAQLDDCDAIITADTNLVAHLDSELPMFLWADTTYATLIGQYPGFRNLCGRSRRHLYALDRLGLARCRRILLASDWAINGAIAAYGLGRERFRRIELGANLGPLDRVTTFADIDRRPSQPIELLFVGTDWQRKGGDRALGLTRQLRDWAIDTRLTIVGAALPEMYREPYRNAVRCLGRLNPDKPAERAQLEAAFRSAHFLVLPSEAECFGHVLCEANGFGVPVLTTDVGGIPSVVQPEVNGFMAPVENWASVMAERVVSMWRQASAYGKLARSARRVYELRLNWTSLGKRVAVEIQRQLDR